MYVYANKCNLISARKFIFLDFSSCILMQRVMIFTKKSSESQYWNYFLACILLAWTWYTFIKRTVSPLSVFQLRKQDEDSKVLTSWSHHLPVPSQLLKLCTHDQACAIMVLASENDMHDVYSLRFCFFHRPYIQKQMVTPSSQCWSPMLPSGLTSNLAS